MTRPFTYNMDPRQQIAALMNRSSTDAQLGGRRDVVGHGAALIAVLLTSGDEQKSMARDLAAQFDPTLPMPNELAKRLAKFVEFDHRYPMRGAPVPAGVRFPTYVFSPILQAAATQTMDQRVAGIPIWRLPITRNELLGYLCASIGLWLPNTIGSFAMRDDKAADLVSDAGELFSGRFGFALHDLADRLLAILAEDPDLYILILSREWQLIAPHLQHAAPLNPPKVILKPVRLLTALEVVFELQRAAVMTWALRHWLALSFYDIRHLTAVDDESTQGSENGHARVAGIFAKNSGSFPMADGLMMQAAALRRFLRCRPNPLIAADLNWLHDAAANRSICWNQPQWARTTRGGEQILAALQAQADMLKRVKGRGYGHHDEHLDIFCGISAYQLPLLAVAAIGKRLTRRSDDDLTNALAEIIHKTLLGPNLWKYTSGSPEHARRKALEFSKTYLPARGKSGSAGRFDPSMWRNRYRDKPLFRGLADYMYDPQSRRVVSRDPTFRRIGLALLFMARRFQRLYRATKITHQMVEITCDLATSVCVLTTDPVFKALLNNVATLVPTKVLTARKWATRQRLSSRKAK